MPTESERATDTYLSTGVATDIGSSQLKEMNDFHRRRMAETGPSGPTRAAGPDGIERMVARLYFGIPRRLFFALALLGGVIGYVAGRTGALDTGDAGPGVVAALGAVAGYLAIPALYIALRLGYWALKLALGFLLLYLAWVYILQPWLEGRPPF